MSGCECGSFRKRGSGPTPPPPPPPPPDPVTIGEATTLIDPEGDSDIAKPPGVIDGTVLVLAVGHNEADFTPPAGFTKIGLSAGWIPPPFNWEQEVFFHVVSDASLEPAFYSMTGGGYRDAWLIPLQNVDPVDPIPIGGFSEEEGSGVVSNGLAVAVTRVGSLLLHFEASDGINRSIIPPGMTGMPANPLDGSFNADYEANLAVGSTGDKDSTYASAVQWATHMIVFQPSM